jgi:hypothetical protein
MMRPVILLAAVIGCIQTLCLGQSSVNINYSGGSGSPNMVGPDQQPLANGNDVEIGYFDSGFNIQQNAGNESALMGAHSSGGAWHPFGTTTIQSGLLISPGGFSSTASKSGSAGTTFAGHPIDLWVFQTKDNAVPAPDFSNVEAYGIYSSSAATWTFPTPGATPVTENITTSDVNDFLFGSSVSGSPGSLELLAVPEPGSLALAGLGLATVLMRVTRRNPKRQAGR